MMNTVKHFSPGVLILVIVCVQACQHSTRNSPPHQQQQTSSNVFDAYLKTDIPPADGFDIAVGDANAASSPGRDDGGYTVRKVHGKDHL